MQRPQLPPLVLPRNQQPRHAENVLGPPRPGSIDPHLFTPEHFEMVPNGRLGEGEGTAVILKFHHTPTGMIMARKQLPMDSNPKKQLQKMREVHVSHNCDSPRIVKCYGSHMTNDMVSLYMEVVEGRSLDALYRQHGRIPEAALAVVTKAVLEGLDYLEKLPEKVVHRDIKPQNILVSNSGDVKLCDFGVARLHGTVHSIANTYTGSQSYMSPERLEFKPATIAGDIWSFGLSLVEVSTGRYPIPELTEQEDREWLSQGRLSAARQAEMKGTRSDFEVLARLRAGPPVTVSGEFFSAEFKSFIDCCLRMKPEDRPTVAQLLQMPFLTQVAANPTALTDWLVSKLNVPEDANEIVAV